MIHWCLQVAYDVMDVDVPQFQADFSTFKRAIRELEHRLGALIVQVRRPWLLRTPRFYAAGGA
jgi:hypothetical protein